MKYKMIVLLAFSISLHAEDFASQLLDPLQGKSRLIPRSESVNAARQLVGIHRYMDLYNECGWYGAAAVTPSYAHTFRSRRIAEYFFGTDCLTVQGSQAGKLQDKALLADYFGLSPHFESNLFVDPKIRNFIIDLNAYIGYQSWYFTIDAPWVDTQCNFELSESVFDEDTNSDFPPLYMDTNAVLAPAQSFRQALAGGITYGQVTEPLRYGTVGCPRTKKSFSEVELSLGYNVINRPNGHVGFNIRGAIPVGNRPDPRYLFAPMVGNGRHGVLGAGFRGHIDIWEGDCEQIIALWCVMNITHLFKTRHIRSFDICPGRFGSRYMLAKEFDDTGNYNGNTIPLINRTTLACDVSIPGEFDLVIMAAYTNPTITFDLGYNGWIRSHEKIHLIHTLAQDTLALKGIQNAATVVGLSNATQSTATIHGNEFVLQAAVADPHPPIFIEPCALDVRSAANPRMFTHKIFGNLQYSFDSICGLSYFPFIGIGGQVEFEGLKPRNQIEPNKNSLSQWGIWVKGGCGF